MRRRDLAAWTIWWLTLMVGAVVCVRPASAAFYLDLSAAGDRQINLALRSDAPIPLVESIDIQLLFDASVFQLVGKPTFEAVLTGADFQSPACGQRVLPGNLRRSNCGGYFDPERAPLETGPLLSWLFQVEGQLPEGKMFDVTVLLGDDEPIVLSKAATLAVPEPSAVTLILAGFALIVLQMRRSSQAHA